MCNVHVHVHCTCIYKLWSRVETERRIVSPGTPLNHVASAYVQCTYMTIHVHVQCHVECYEHVIPCMIIIITTHMYTVCRSPNVLVLFWKCLSFQHMYGMATVCIYSSTVSKAVVWSSSLSAYSSMHLK